MLFPLINKVNFVQYQGYRSVHVYIVLDSGSFKVLSGNQWKATLWNNEVQMNVVIYLKICYWYVQISQILVY